MVLSNIFRWHASHGLRNKVFWLIVLPVFSIMVVISVLTVLNKITVERELLQDRVKTYARLLEGGDLSLESVEDSARLESFLAETVRYAGLFNREHLAVYETGKKRGSQYAPVVDPRRVDQAFEGYDITLIETRGDSGSILGTYYPIIVDGTVVSVLHVEASFERSTQRISQYIFFIVSLNLLAFLAMFFLITIVLDRIVLSRIRMLRQLSINISNGESDCRVNKRLLKTADELGGFARVFDGMIVALSESKRRLQEYSDDLEHKVETRTLELRLAKDTAEKACQSAEKANQAKSVFLSNMSHELRTPLNAVLGFSQLMKYAPEATPAQMENLDIITRSGEHLLNLINNVLEISKIEAGRVGLEASPLDLHQLLQEMTSLMVVRAQEKGLDFTLEQSRDLPRHVSLDGSKLRQVLLNLIGNAIKHTASGAVILRAMAAQKEGGLRFEVDDTGPGIREEERERIFSPFEQLEDLQTTEAGTGLGLAISKQYVALMGGTIGVAGEPGQGAIFYFEIPVTVLSSEAAPAEPLRGRLMGPAEGQPRYRLLIAEDQPENRLLLRKLLEPLGFDLREAVNGQAAVDLFKLWRPHLIWMDMRMPVMDGLEATRQIRATAAGAQTKIVAITAHALEEERRDILAAGCDDFIRKPYKDAEIIDALTKHLGVRFVYGEAAPPAAGALPLTAAALAELPDAMRNELEQALVRIDIGAVNRAIEAIRVQHPSVADELGTVARDLQFGRILRLIGADHGETSSEDQA